MQRRSWLRIVFLVLISGAAFAAPVDYTISLAEPYAHILHVQVHVPAGAAERDVQLPAWNTLYQIRDFAQNVRSFQALDFSHHALPAEMTDKTTWHITNARDGFEIAYDLFADQPGPYGAQLNTEHAFLNLAEVLIYVPDARQSPVTLTFANVPSGWHVATALSRSRSGPANAMQFVADTYDQLVDSPVELGNFRETSFHLGGANYRIVVHADAGDYDMKAVEDSVRKIVAAGVAWMQDRPFAEYLFIYHFPRVTNGTGGGMEHAYCTAIDVSADHMKADSLALPRVTAHEFFHLWNVKRIRPASLEPVDYVHENYTRALWFSEGVTNTVQEILLLRAGILDQRGYLASLAYDIRTLEQRPAHRTQSAEESSLDAWLEKYPQYRSPERSISYYTKGEILGVLLDLAVRRATSGQKSLREVFEWMNEHYAKQGRFFRDSQGVEAAVEAVTGKDFSWFFRAYVTGVEELPYAELLSTVGLKLVETKTTVPALGFDSVRNSKRQAWVTAVDQRSDAQKSGLVSGDVIVQVNGNEVSSDPEAMVASMHIGDTVKLKINNSKGATREIKIKLGSREEDDFSIVEADNPTAEERTRRVAWLAGEAEVAPRDVKVLNGNAAKPGSGDTPVAPGGRHP
jgi:predicted metalloprotease with PDZ domain